jgi:hypothetical protein
MKMRCTCEAPVRGPVSERGLVFAPTATARYNGAIYGPGSGSAPALTVAYTK